MAVFYDQENPSTLLQIMDYTIATIALISFTLSLLLNSAVIGYFVQTYRRNTISKMYCILSALFLTKGATYPLIVCYNFYKSEDGAEIPEELLMVSCAMFLLSFQSSGFLLTCICILRLHSLKFPLRLLSSRQVTKAMMGSLLLAVAVCGVSLLEYSGVGVQGHTEAYFNPYKQFYVLKTTEAEAFGWPALVVRCAFFVNFGVCILVCVLTWQVLHTSDTQVGGANQEARRQGTRTILYMNLTYTGIVLYMAIVVVTVLVNNPSVMNTMALKLLSLIAFPVMPLLMGVANPALMVIRGKGLREWVRGLVVKGKVVRTGTVRSSVSVRTSVSIRNHSVRSGADG